MLELSRGVLGAHLTRSWLSCRRGGSSSTVCGGGVSELLGTRECEGMVEMG